MTLSQLIIMQDESEKVSRFITVPGFNLQIDLFRAQIMYNGRELCLSRRSYSLLVLLAANPTKKFSIQDMITHVGYASRQSVDAEISRLRVLFDQKMIVTHGKHGATTYSLVNP